MPGSAALRALALTALCVACGEGLHPRPALDCDPLSGAGCDPGQTCRLIAGGGLACLVARPESADCQPGSCPVGATCLEVEGLRGCRPICELARPDRGCGRGACAIEVGGGVWGICAEPCVPGASCGVGATCAPVPGLRFPLCVGVGAAAAGAACDANRCGPDLACLGAPGERPRCVEICTPGGLTCLHGACEGPIPEVDGVSYCLER